MVTPYLSQQPVDDFGSRFADLKYSATVPATTDTIFPVPGNAQRYKMVVKVKSAGEAWMAINSVAASPAGATFVSTTSELITGDEKTCREVRANDIIHFFSSAGTDIGIILYAVGTNN